MTTASTAIDVPNLPYSFNLPPHPSIMHKVADLGASPSNVDAANKSIYDETATVYSLPSGDFSTFQNMRLGRLIMWNKVLSYMILNEGHRYGFRFLYNPTTVSGQVNVGTDFIPDPSSTVGGMLQSGLETINFELLINRMPEVQGNAKHTDYGVYCTPEILKEYQTRGTHYDVEYLYRIANGIHNTNFRQGTGDIGILLPNPSELFLGPFRSRGALLQLSVTDQLFNAYMVPMLSYVQVSFGRYLAFNPTEDELARLGSSGVAIPGSDGSTDSGSSSGSTDPNAGNEGSNEGQPPDGNDKEAPVPGYNTVTTGWKYSSGSAHGGWDYGIGGIKGKIVKATRGGVVDRVKKLTDSYGWHVVIRTGSVYHYYCHLSEIDGSMKAGATVEPGSVVGRVGNTGNVKGSNGGYHLHYEERENDKQHSRHPQWAAAQEGSIPGGR